MTYRKPRQTDKTLVGFDEIPDWVNGFHVDDDFPLDDATPEELRAAYADWQAKVREWRATHETPGVAEAIAVPDEPWDPSLV
jgi:hypothetical protein